MPRGGDASRRNGKLGGRPPGAPNVATISANEQKQLAREVIREHIREHIPAIVKAQTENALGITYMVIRDKNGSYVEATNQAQVHAALAAGGDAFRLYTRQPHQAAAAMLFAYAADKPVEPIEISGDPDKPVVFKWQD